MFFVRKLEKKYVALLVVVLLSIPLLFTGQHTVKAASSVQHYLYVFPDGGIDVYDMDNRYKLVKQIKLPVFSGGRGSVVDAASNALYLSYGGDGGDHGDGSLLKYNLLTDTIIQKIGPLAAGVRPFTINSAETLAFTTASGVLGFQVSSITSGQVLYTVGVNGFTAPDNAPVPSHGITLSPDEKEIYVVDTANSYVHVYDVSGLPATAPKQVADIPLRKI